MIYIGAMGVLALVVIVLLVAAVTLWSGLRAFRDELRPGFKTRPPDARSISLTILGVALPVLMIGLFTIYLAVVLLRVVFGAL